jgi:hypothetical protein
MIPEGMNYCIGKVEDDIAKKYALIDSVFKELVGHTNTLKGNFNAILDISDKNTIDKYIEDMSDSITKMSRIYDNNKTFYRSKEGRVLFDTYYKNYDKLCTLIYKLDKASVDEH